MLQEHQQGQKNGVAAAEHQQGKKQHRRRTPTRAKPGDEKRLPLFQHQLVPLMNWKEYEEFVFNYFQSKYREANIKHNASKKGYLSLTSRQIDILITQYICGYEIEIAIECKNWNKPLDVEDVEKFISKLNDIKVTKGAMVCRNGYTKAAKRLATSAGNLQLHVLSIEELEAFTGFWGNPYSGHVGAIVFPPNGWILDSSIPAETIGSTLCVLRPMEISMENAFKNRECILFYIPFKSQEETPYEQLENKLVEIIEEQRKGTIEFDSSVKFTFWDDVLRIGNVKFRLTEYSSYNEVAGFICTPYCIMALYGICRKELTELFKEHVKFVLSELLIVILQGVDPDNSHDAWIAFLQNITSAGEIQKVIYQ
ncbi:MAG: hypothetical protein JWQ09_5685 [Segetibacter sp.]|nr:hypothetical protein [Segetibacter sp.]